MVLIVVLLAAGVTIDSVMNPPGSHRSHNDSAVIYLVGVMLLLWGLSSFVYFGCCELFRRGQTIGKRSSKIRVIKSDGFQLDAGSILVRNLFRVVDHLPPMWLFPILSRRSQRAGDMVAGTLVVFDAAANLSSVRTMLGARTAAEAQFRFDASLLKRLNANDFRALESVLDRLPDLAAGERLNLLHIYTSQIAKKMAIDPPPRDQQQPFLEDLLAAELRRQDRSLG